jgi:ABC-2 type transport system permease protein
MSLLESIGRTVAVARKEVRQLRRDRLTFGMVVAIPIMQLVLFGDAINQDVRHLRAGVVDHAKTRLSRTMLAAAEASQTIDLVASVGSAAELERLLREGRIAVGIIVPADFERRAEERGRRGAAARPVAQVLVDGADPANAAAVSGLLQLSLPTRQGLVAAERAATFELHKLYNPEGRSAVNVVPGLVGVILTMTMVLFTSVAIVRERERGNLELLITTPLKSVELMIGKILPYVALGLLQVGLVLGAGAILFRTPMRGEAPDLILACLVFITASLTLGLVISTIAKTQFQAFQLTFFTFLPQILLSGFMFPFDAMPKPARIVAEILPLTHFLRVIRGIVLRGASLAEVQRDLWPLVGFAALMLGISVARFRKRLD